MTKDYSRAHIDGAEDLFCLIRDSNLDFNSPRIWGNILRYMVVCQNIETIAYSTKKSKIRVLDIGCSNATLFGFIKQNFKFYEAKEIEYVGVDVRHSSLEDARRIYNDEPILIHHDLNVSPLHEVLDAKFDLISAQQVLEHVGKEDAELMLASCYKLLEDSGRLILSAPNPHKHEGEEFIHSISAADVLKHGHIFEFSFDEVNSALVENGFAILEHMGALTREMTRNLDANTEEERYVANTVRKFSYGFFVAMFATIYPDKSKNYLIVAEKNKNGQH